jgi:hypothetical protein
VTAPISDTVNITTSADTVTLTRPGFGTGLVLSATAAFAERVRTYNSLADVAVDFPVTTSAEYLAAQAYFSQNPRPTALKIGRSALPPTQVYSIGVAAVRHSYAYSVVIKGHGFAGGTATFTSDSNATNDEIIAGLVTAINGISGNNYLAAVVDSGTSDTLTVTADAAGGWFSLSVNAADLTMRQTHADPGIATDLAAIALEDNDWYLLVTLYNSKAYVDAAAAWVEANKKIYAVDLSETAALTAAVGGGGNDTADGLHTLAYDRSFVAWSPAPADMFGAAWAGRTLPITPGGETWKFKRLSGVSPSSMTGTHRVNLRAKKANWYEATAGVNITYDGTVASGEFIDITRGIDWLESEMAIAVMTMLIANDKVPYEDDGVTAVESEVRGVLDRAVQARVLARNPEPVVTVPAVADIADADKAARLLPDVKWSATKSGAIHKININGVVTV